MFEWLLNGKKLHDNGVLGMNDRNYSVIAQYNKRSLYTLVDDKVKTKKLANSININTPKMIGIIEHQYEVKNLLDMVRGYDTFVIKPAHGSGGKGVLVIKKHDGQNGFQTPADHLEGDFRHLVHDGQKQNREGQPQGVGGRKEQHNIENRQHQLEPGVEPVDEAVPGEVLADGNIPQHYASPPFLFSPTARRGRVRFSPASRRALASRMVFTA